MADRDQVDILIKTTADTAGAKAAASALGDVTAATRKGADQAKDTAKNINSLGESYEKGAAAGRVLQSALTGNITSLGQLGAAIKAVGAALLANPLLTLGAVAASLILPALQKIVDGWRMIEQRSRDAGKASAEAAKGALDAISARQDNALADAFAEISRRAAEARAQIDAVTQAITAQTDADEALALAKIAADPALSDLQKAEQTAGVRADFRGRRATIQQNQMAAQEAVAAQEAASAAAAAEQARQREASAGALVSRLGARSPEVIRRELADQQRQRDAITNGGTITQEGQDKLAQISQREADLREELTREEEAFAPRLKAAQERLAKATEARAKAEEEAEQAARAQAALGSINDAKRIANAATVAGQNAVDQVNLGPRREKALEAIPEQQARAALARVRNPVDLDANQEQAITQRALEINKNALAQEGRQAGETIGEALGLALREAFPQLTNELLRNVRAQVDQAVKTEISRVSKGLLN